MLYLSGPLSNTTSSSELFLIILVYRVLFFTFTSAAGFAINTQVTLIYMSVHLVCYCTGVCVSVLSPKVAWRTKNKTNLYLRVRLSKFRGGLPLHVLRPIAQPLHDSVSSMDCWGYYSPPPVYGRIQRYTISSAEQGPDTWEAVSEHWFLSFITARISRTGVTPCMSALPLSGSHFKYLWNSYWE